MDLQRWTNVTASRMAYQAASPLAAEYPLEAFFEVSARCNIRCEMCAINYDSRYKPQSGRPPFFEPELFEKLRPIFPTLLRGFLFGLGEPTLNRHLVDYVRDLSSHGAEVWFNTNATRIDERKAEELAIAGADRITVSIDGATAETYERIRRGATFTSVMRGIRALVAAQRIYGRPRVDLAMVAMASNIGEMTAMVDLAADLGVSGLHIEPLYQQPASAELLEHYERENAQIAGSARVARAFADAAARARERGVAFQSRHAGEANEFDYARRAHRVTWTCSEPWSSIWVTSAGEVRTCCTNEVAFGNLFERPFDEIWNGAPFRRFREQHIAREVADGCANCIRNGRVRHSPMYRTLKPVVYAPLFETLPPASDDDPIAIASPAAGENVTDPLALDGRFEGDAVDWELMIDETAVANLNDKSQLENDRFRLALPLPFVTEGAHTLWFRRRRDGIGFGWREVFLWRP